MNLSEYKTDMRMKPILLFFYNCSLYLGAILAFLMLLPGYFFQSANFQTILVSSIVALVFSGLTTKFIPKFSQHIPRFSTKSTIFFGAWLIAALVILPKPNIYRVHTFSFTTQTKETPNQDYYDAELLTEKSRASSKDDAKKLAPTPLLNFYGLKDDADRPILTASEFKYPDSWQLWFYGNQALGYMNGKKSRVNIGAPLLTPSNTVNLRFKSKIKQKIVVNINGAQTLMTLKRGMNYVPVTIEPNVNLKRSYILSTIYYASFFFVILLSFKLVSFLILHPINFKKYPHVFIPAAVIAVVALLYFPTINHVTTGTAEFTNLIQVRKPFYRWTWNSGRPMSVVLFRNVFAHVDNIYEIYLAKLFTLTGLLMSISVLYLVFNRVIKNALVAGLIIIIIATLPSWNALVLIYASLVYGVLLAILSLYTAIRCIESDIRLRSYVYGVLAVLLALSSSFFSQIVPQAILVGLVPYIFFLDKDEENYRNSLSVIGFGILLTVIAFLTVYYIGTVWDDTGKFKRRGQLSFAFWNKIGWLFDKPLTAIHSLWNFGDAGRPKDHFFAFIVASISLCGIFGFKPPTKQGVLKFILYGVILGLAFAHIILIGSNTYQVRIVTPSAAIATTLFCLSIFYFCKNRVNDRIAIGLLFGLACIMGGVMQKRVHVEYDSLQTNHFVAMRQAVHMIDTENYEKIYVILPDVANQETISKQSRFGTSVLGHYGTTAFRIRWPLRRYFYEALSTMPADESAKIKKMELVFGYGWQDVPEDAYVIDMGWLSRERMH